MLMFIVPPFFWAGDEALEGLLDAVPARAAETSIVAPIAPMAPESHTRFRIVLLSDGYSLPVFRRMRAAVVSRRSRKFPSDLHRVKQASTVIRGFERLE